MSTISKLAVIGLASIGAAIALAGTTTSASAEDIRGRCDGTLKVAAAYRADVNHERNHIFTSGTRDQVAVRLSPAGNFRWFCDSPTEGLVEFRDNCGAEGRTTLQVRFRNDGGVRLTCA